LGGVDFINLATPAQQGGTGARPYSWRESAQYTGFVIGDRSRREEIDAVLDGGSQDVVVPTFDDTNVWRGE